MLLPKVQNFGFFFFFYISFSIKSFWSRTHSAFSYYDLVSSNLWQFLSLSWPFMTLIKLRRAFGQVLRRMPLILFSVGFAWFLWGYRFEGRIPERWGGFSHHFKTCAFNWIWKSQAIKWHNIKQILSGRNK